jgi:hypothetical protein
LYCNIAVGLDRALLRAVIICDAGGSLDRCRYAANAVIGGTVDNGVDCGKLFGIAHALGTVPP